MAETKGKKVLIAEDDKFLAKAYEAKLEKSGFDVTIAKDGEEALSLMKQTKPDLVLLDLVMPVKNGFEVLEEISKDATLKKIPVIIVSNLGQESDVTHGKELLGVADYLVKAEYSLQQVTDLIASKLR